MSERDRPQRGPKREESPAEADRSEGSGVGGRATAGGNAPLSQRASRSLPGHFRCPDDLWLSSLALGTRRGRPWRRRRSPLPQGDQPSAWKRASTSSTPHSPIAARRASGRLGTSSAAWHSRKQVAARDEVVVVTKGGELCVDAGAISHGAHPQHELHETYVDTGLLEPEPGGEREQPGAALPARSDRPQPPQPRVVHPRRLPDPGARSAPARARPERLSPRAVRGVRDARRRRA